MCIKNFHAYKWQIDTENEIKGENREMIGDDTKMRVSVAKACKIEKITSEI